MLLYVPPRKPEEYFLGLLYRCMYTGSQVRMKDLAMALVGRQTIQAPWSLPSNLKQLCEYFWPVFSSPEQLLNENTCLPAYLPFAKERSVAAVLAHAIDGQRHLGLAASIGLTGRAIETKPMLAVCLACIEEDLERFQLSYFHREHALAGVTYCAEHGLPLYVGCGNCRFSLSGSRHAQLATAYCRCGEPRALSAEAVSPADGEVLTAMARYARQIVRGALAGRSATELGRFYQHAACSDGFRDGTRIDSTGLTRELNQVYSPMVLKALNATLGSFKWSNSVLGKGVAPPMLGRNLLLLDFFGGMVPTAEDLAEAEEGYQQRMTRRAQQRPDYSSTTQSDIARDREAILKYLAQNPQATRQSTLEALGKTAMRARERDSVWYDQFMPAVLRARQRDTKEDSDAYLYELDEDACAHVRRRHGELRESVSDSPKQLTKSALLKGFRRGNEVGKSWLERLPKTAKALAECIETRRQFQHRFARTILSRPCDIDYLIAEVVHRTGLSSAEAEQLNLGLLKKVYGTS